MSRLTLKPFDIDARQGFLGAEPPLRRLTGAYAQWEVYLEDAMKNFVYTGSDVTHITRRERAYACLWRKRIRFMPALDCSDLCKDLRKLQRAHHVLAYITQFFVHSLPPRDHSKPSSKPIVIPAPLAIPFVDVSRRLGIAPIVTYADTVLWNWDKIDSSLPLSRTNIRIRDLFTGSPQEEHFFLTSARIEIEGWESLDAMECCIDAAESGDSTQVDVVSHHLRRLSYSIDNITTILLAVRDGLDADFFYNRFRPWIQGADQGVDSPKWLYEGVDGVGLTLQPSGPSAGQSALMHSFDAFLDVPHPHGKAGLGGGCTRFNSALDPHAPLASPCLPKDHPPVAASYFPPTPPSTPPATPQTLTFSLDELPSYSQSITPLSPPATPQELPPMPSIADIDTSFNARMRSYMTQPHTDFLAAVTKNSIRSFVQEHRPEASPDDGDECGLSFSRRRSALELGVAYDAAVIALKRWRDAHIRIVTQYVIVPARAVGGANEPGNRVYINDDTGESVERERKPVRGTGGTSLVPLLKIYRNNTLGRLLGFR